MIVEMDYTFHFLLFLVSLYLLPWVQALFLYLIDYKERIWGAFGAHLERYRWKVLGFATGEGRIIIGKQLRRVFLSPSGGGYRPPYTPAPSSFFRHKKMPPLAVARRGKLWSLILWNFTQQVQGIIRR